MPTILNATDAGARRPLIIEVAVNGARDRSVNQHVPLSADEIVASVDACVAAGASIVHAHAGRPVVGSGGHHDSAVYADAFARILSRHPDLLLYPTLPGGGPGTTMARRLAHVRELAERGLVGMLPVDPGTMNYGAVDASGRPPTHEAVYQTTYADVDQGLSIARGLGLPCTLSAFEAGFARLAEAHRRAGSLPAGSLLKLEFSAGARLFGMSPDETGLAAWLRLFDPDKLAWMVTLRDGDVTERLASLAIEQGGHVRVGIEDYAGDRQPRNEELVAAAASLGAAHGRRPAMPSEVRALLKPEAA